jgi:hypothetical protein
MEQAKDGRPRERAMKAGMKVFWLAAAVLVIAFGAAHLLVPDVVAIADSDEPQPSWAVLTAFLLRSVELTAGWVAAIALVVMLAILVRRRLRPSAPAD